MAYINTNKLFVLLTLFAVTLGFSGCENTKQSGLEDSTPGIEAKRESSETYEQHSGITAMNIPADSVSSPTPIESIETKTPAQNKSMVAKINSISPQNHNPPTMEISEAQSSLVNDDITENGTTKSYTKELIYEDIEVLIKGKYLPPLVQGYEDTAVGLVVPEIKGVGIDGSEIYLGGKGPTTLVMVLAHWCPHCRNEVRELAPFLNETDHMDKIRMITLLTSINEERANYPPHEWLDLEEWPMKSIVDTPSSNIAAALGVTSYPFVLVIDDRGEIVVRIPGRLGIETLTKLLEAIGELSINSQ